jgi:hypothetical protein
MQLHKFYTSPDGVSRYVAHGVCVVGSNRRFSIWFSDAGLMDAEGYDSLRRVRAVKRSSPTWRALKLRAKNMAEDIASGRLAVAEPAAADKLA